MARYCKFCKEQFKLPAPGQSNSHWIWENKNDRRSGGGFLCRSNRSAKKRVAWDNFYKKNHLRCVVSRSVAQKLKNRGLKKNKSSILDHMPFTINQLKQHLESQFQPGMSWDNYGEWHVDHIKPDSLFQYASMKDNDFLNSWNMNNLRPLWAHENKRKYNKFAGGGVSRY